MNANELIDLLHTEDVQFSQQSLNGWAEEATTMLRQQQAEIEALKVKLSLWEEFGRQVVGNYPSTHGTS